VGGGEGSFELLEEELKSDGSDEDSSDDIDNWLQFFWGGGSRRITESEWGLSFAV
jgi:hypothetical protein